MHEKDEQERARKLVRERSEHDGYTLNMSVWGVHMFVWKRRRRATRLPTRLLQ